MNYKKTTAKKSKTKKYTVKKAKKYIVKKKKY